MTMARLLLFGVLAVPLAELAVFIAVAVAIGFGWAVLLVFAGMAAGVLVLRHAGGSHIARMRVAMADGNVAAISADGPGGLVLLAGFLLLVPGFITDFVALLLLIAPLRRGVAALLGRTQPARAEDGIVDLEPEQWRRVPDPELPPRRNADPPA